MEAESRIAEVTLYAHGARIRRAASIALTPSDTRVRIVGLPVAALDATVRIEADGATVTGLHVGLDTSPHDAAPEDLPEVRAARLRAALANVEVERIDAALAALAAAPIALTDPSDEPAPAWSAIVDARRALVTVRADRELALREQAAAARREAGDAERVLVAALDRDRRRSSAQGAKLHELRKYVELELEGSGAATLSLEYQVEAARWSPSYTARFEGDRVTLEVRAMIAQDTGEDWTGVTLRLSTAEPERFGGLPELAAQRIGRRQAEPARAGFRAPPLGAAALYVDYLRAFPDAARAAQSGTTEGDGEDTARVRPAALLDRDALTLHEDADELMTLVDDAPTPARAFFKAIAAPGAMPPPPAAMPPPAAAMRLSLGAVPPMRAKRAAKTAHDLVPAEQTSPGEPPPPPVRLDYTNLRMAPPSSRERGALVSASPDGDAPARIRSTIAAATARVLSLALPAGHSARWSHTYDYAFAADGAVDVLSDGAWHSVAVTAKSGTAKLRHVAVPREQADVFRLAVLANPLAGPLLPGPIDIYDRGRFLITSEVDHTPPGAPVEIGLGVDAAVKLSRNTEFREETTGVLRGGLRLHHAIKIDVDNLSERAIDLEVRERLPVTRDDDDDVEVVAGRVEPAWERFSPDTSAPHEPRLRGGYRWRLAVPAGGKRALRAAYEVRIAGKHELAGGNRRES